MKKLFSFFTAILFLATVNISVLAEAPQCVKDLMQTESMKNADFSLIVKEVDSGDIIYDYNIKNNMVPASTLKTVTTSTALEILGADYRYQTLLQHDGEIKDGVLNGNIFIRGSGDPTLGSEHFDSSNKFLDDWTSSIQKLGIKKITGSIIADESIFDSQGVHPKWLVEDIGNYYTAGVYGINVFDNMYKLTLKSGEIGSKPTIETIRPNLEIDFENHLTVSNNSVGASIVGIPFSNERYLFGSIEPDSSCVIKGDIPDPALYLADFLTNKIKSLEILVDGEPSCSRLLNESGKSLPKDRKQITVTYSPPLNKIIKVTNHKSLNLCADALLKTIGASYPETDENLSSFEKGVKVLKNYWKEKGIDSSLIIYDGSGLCAPNRINSLFICEILEFMAKKSSASEVFVNSLPKAGVEGTVQSFLHGTHLQGKAMLKSGWMGCTQCYAGYVIKDNRKYVVCVFANNYNCTTREIKKYVEEILLKLFP